MRSFWIALALLSLVSGAQAVEISQWQQPKAELDRMIGFWEVTTFARDTNGEWQAGHITLSSIGHEPGGAVLREDALVVETRNRLDLVGYWSWDHLNDTYRVAVMDKRLGDVDVYEGTDTEDGLVLTKDSSGKVFTGGERGDGLVRLRQEFPGPQRYILYVEESIGDSWEDFLRIEYRKKSPQAGPTAEILMQNRDFVSGSNML